MIFASCRQQHFGGSILFDDKLHWSGDPISTVDKKRTAVIVHGTANTVAELERLAGEIASRTSGSYDAYVMFAWPGGATGLAYLTTRFTAVGRAAEFLAKVLTMIALSGAETIDVDAHSLGVPIALEAARRSIVKVDGLWLKAGACSRDLGKYRKLAEEGMAVNVFYSPRDLIVVGLYRLWFGFSGALGAYGEKTKGGNIGVQWDVSSEIGGSHIDYRRSSIVVQAMRNEAARRAVAR